MRFSGKQIVPQIEKVVLSRALIFSRLCQMLKKPLLGFSKVPRREANPRLANFF
jgi:hypothetical protein